MGTSIRRFAILAGLLTFACIPASLAAPALGEGIPKWEYAELHFKRTFIELPPDADGMRGNRALKIVLVWSLEGEEIEADGWKHLADQLKAPAAKDKATSVQQKLRVLNHLGRQGWELIEHQPPSDPAPGRGLSRPEIWQFKRRLP